MGKKYVSPSMKVKEIEAEAMMAASGTDTGESGGESFGKQNDFGVEESAAKSNNAWSSEE